MTLNSDIKNKMNPLINPGIKSNLWDLLEKKLKWLWVFIPPEDLALSEMLCFPKCCVFSNVVSTVLMLASRQQTQLPNKKM